MFRRQADRPSLGEPGIWPGFLTLTHKFLGLKYSYQRQACS